jgi:cytochrome b561
METTSMSEQYQLELIRSYASSGFAAVVTINSGALIAGLSQAGNLDVFPPATIGFAVFVWALGVTTGVATWGAAYRGVVALASSDHREQMRWRSVANGLFHVSLSMFLIGFAVVGLALAT